MTEDQVRKAREGWKRSVVTEDNMKLLKVELENHVKAFNATVDKLCDSGARVEFTVIDSSGVSFESRPFIHGIKVMRQI